MSIYTPLFVYLTPASIPQVVAHIQKYLADNPIVSDPESIAEVIQQYIEEHPEIIAVASVNGETGNVVLTGSDININASSAVSIETQLLNLASMISAAGSDITQIESQLTTIYTNIGTIETNVSNNTTAISALQTSVEGHGTRLSTAESDIDALESAQTAQGTRLNTAEGNISSLQTRMTQAETDIDNNESSIETLQTRMTQAETDVDSLETSFTWTLAGTSTSASESVSYPADAKELYLIARVEDSYPTYTGHLDFSMALWSGSISFVIGGYYSASNDFGSAIANVNRAERTVKLTEIRYASKTTGKLYVYYR